MFAKLQSVVRGGGGGGGVWEGITGGRGRERNGGGSRGAKSSSSVVCGGGGEGRGRGRGVQEPSKEVNVSGRGSGDGGGGGSNGVSGSGRGWGVQEPSKEVNVSGDGGGSGIADIQRQNTDDKCLQVNCHGQDVQNNISRCDNDDNNNSSNNNKDNNNSNVNSNDHSNGSSNCGGSNYNSVRSSNFSSNSSSSSSSGGGGSGSDCSSRSCSMRKNNDSDSSNIYSMCNDVEHLHELSESAAGCTMTDASYTISAPERCTRPSTSTPTPTPTTSTTTTTITTTSETTTTTTTTANNNNNDDNIKTTRVRKFTCHSINSSSCSNTSTSSCNKTNTCCNNQVQPMSTEVSVKSKSNTYNNKCYSNNNIIERQPQFKIKIDGSNKQLDNKDSEETRKLRNHAEILKEIETSLVATNSKASTMPQSRATAIVAAACRTQSYNYKTVQSAMAQKPPERRVTAFERISTDLKTNPKLIRELSLGKRIGFYRIRGELGSGNFSSVKLGIHTLVKEKVAIKILDKTRLDLKTQRLLSREIETMEHLCHPNIIRLYEVVETPAKVHLIMEYAPGGELFTKISNEGRLTEPEAKFIFAQILSAVEHMHSHYIIHRDLKAENVFYAAPFFVKVGDFGFSTICHSEQQELNTFCGSPPYAAPELFRDDIYYGTFVDIWALGILLYFMVTGSMPFRAENVTRMKKCILNGMYAIPMFVSDSCHFLIRGILRPLPQDRFTIKEIKNSEWLSGENYPKALPPYRLCPTVNLTELKAEEQETIKVLCQLGITEEHLKEAIRKNTRNSIIGAYRIVLHRIQKKNQDKDIYAIAEFSSRLFKQQDNKKKMRSHISKLCTIL